MMPFTVWSIAGMRPPFHLLDWRTPSLPHRNTSSVRSCTRHDDNARGYNAAAEPQLAAKPPRRKTTPRSSAPKASSIHAQSHDSTVQVLSRARQGDRSAVRILIERIIPMLRKRMHGRIPSAGRGAEDTEDLVQEAVLRTLRRGGAFEHRSVVSLQKYLRTTVENSILDIGRRVRRRGVPIDLPETLEVDEPSPEDEAILREQSDRFSEALAHLRPLDRLVLIWRFESGASYEDIAHRLGKSVETTHMIVSRARKRLKAKLDL